MKDNLYKYLAGEIDREALSAAELEELSQLERLEESIKKSGLIETPDHVRTNILLKYDVMVSRRSSRRLIKWWITVVTALVTFTFASFIIVPFQEIAQTPITDQLTETLSYLNKLLIADETISLFVFVNLITLLFILDKILVRKLKHQS